MRTSHFFSLQAEDQFDWKLYAFLPPHFIGSFKKCQSYLTVDSERGLAAFLIVGRHFAAATLRSVRNFSTLGVASHWKYVTF